MVIIETSIFTKQVKSLLSDDDYHRLQLELASRPDAGVLIPGGGGLRKLRWTASGRGKRGGSRIIYFWAVTQHQILLLLIYPKNVKDDLTRAQLRRLRRLIEDEFP